mmetsp:Transcript_27459/g.60091  ORF Transcript_27459/g.60091 Transcript_27459/m.60091 type:complete len:220 (-) Transcript_27459:1028-1687(-)
MVHIYPHSRGEHAGGLRRHYNASSSLQWSLWTSDQLCQTSRLLRLPHAWPRSPPAQPALPLVPLELLLGQLGLPLALPDPRSCAGVPLLRAAATPHPDGTLLALSAQNAPLPPQPSQWIAALPMACSHLEAEPPESRCRGHAARSLWEEPVRTCQSLLALNHSGWCRRLKDDQASALLLPHPAAGRQSHYLYQEIWCLAQTCHHPQKLQPNQPQLTAAT